MSYDYKDNTTTGLALLGVGLVVFIMMVFGFLYSVLVVGFVGMKLWAWFVAPTFGLKALTLVQAWGIALLMGLWTHQLHTPTNQDERTKSDKVSALVTSLLWPWVTLLFAWIGKSWLM